MNWNFSYYPVNWATDWSFTLRNLLQYNRPAVRPENFEKLFKATFSLKFLQTTVISQNFIHGFFRTHSTNEAVIVVHESANKDELLSRLYVIHGCSMSVKRFKDLPSRNDVIIERWSCSRLRKRCSWVRAHLRAGEGLDYSGGTSSFSKTTRTLQITRSRAEFQLTQWLLFARNPWETVPLIMFIVRYIKFRKVDRTNYDEFARFSLFLAVFVGVVTSLWKRKTAVDKLVAFM